MVSLDQAISPVVEQLEKLFPQSESANPSSPVVPPLWYVSLKLGLPPSIPSHGAELPIALVRLMCRILLAVKQ